MHRHPLPKRGRSLTKLSLTARRTAGAGAGAGGDAGVAGVAGVVSPGLISELSELAN
jgi:hypothetical protein